LLKAPSWRWTVSGVVVLGVAAYQHFTCPRGGAGAAPLGAIAAPPHSPVVVKLRIERRKVESSATEMADE
jgi:hypothetical protein